jgi:hypothetical protein
MVFENVKTLEKKGQPIMKLTSVTYIRCQQCIRATDNETDISHLHTLSAMYILTTCYFHLYIGHDLPFILCYELNSVNVNPLISKGDS